MFFEKDPLTKRRQIKQRKYSRIRLKVCPRLLKKSRTGDREMAKLRSKKGQIAEFAPALMVFVCFVLVPLIDIAFIPVRYFIAEGVVNQYTHTLSLAGSRKKAYDMLTANTGEDSWWRGFLQNCGMTVHDPKLVLVVCGSNPGDKIVVNKSEDIPAAYLPGSAKQCVYSLEMTVEIDIPPLYNGSAGLPGLTSPITMKFASRSNWENLGRNPVSREYFVNEKA